MNRYDVKVLDKDGEYITTINPNVIMGDITFNSNVNGGLGQLTLKLALPFDDTTISSSNLIKITLFNERYKNGKQIYIGYVSKISRVLDTNNSYIQITALGIHSLLKNVLYSGTYSGDVTTLLTSIINAFNAKYAGNLLSIGAIDTYSDTITLELDNNTTCFDAINAINDVCNYYWHVDALGKFYFKIKGNQKNHMLVNKVNLESLTYTEDIEDVVNSLKLARNWGTIKTYTSATSIALYWNKEKYEAENNLADESTQNLYGNAYITEYNTPKYACSVVVNNSYDMESIEPWDIINIVNVDYPITNLRVEKIKYTPDKTTLTMDDNPTLWDTINSK